MRGENSTISLADGGEYGVGVYMGEGVKGASLTKTVIKGGGKGVGVYAVGGENLVMRLEGVKISEVGAGVYVKRGKSLTIGGENSTISLASGGRYGVYMGDGVERAELTGTVIMGQDKGVGVYAVGGKSLMMTLDDVTVEGVQMGVYVKRGKSLTIGGENSTISLASGGRYGVYMGDKVESASLMGTRIMGGGSGSMGVSALGGENLVMRLTDVTIEGVGAGVYMGRGKNLTMTGGSTINFMGDGVGVMVGGLVKSASLTKTVITGKGSGVGSMGVSAVGGEMLEMTLDDVTVEGVQMGVVVGKGKNLTIRLTDVKISKVGAGVRVMGGKSLMMTGGSVTEFTGYGVYVGDGVESAELTRTVIKGKGSGMGTGVIMESSGKMTLENVTISKVQTGVYAENG
ncbi:hypothetical protein GGR10_001423, partial [Bartonella chomelii]